MFRHGRWLLTRPVDVFVKDLFMLYFVSFLNEGTSNAVQNNVSFNISISKKQRSFDRCHVTLRNLNSSLNTCVADRCPLYKQKRGGGAAEK